MEWGVHSESPPPHFIVVHDTAIGQRKYMHAHVPEDKKVVCQESAFVDVYSEG